MAVLIEMFSVVIRIETIEEKYPGGKEAFRKSCPEGTFCMDNNIASVIGFPMLQRADDFAYSLTRFGIRYVVDDRFDEVAVVDMYDGPAILTCPWLEFEGRKIFDTEPGLSVCKLKGDTSTIVAMPLSCYQAHKDGRRCGAMDVKEAENRLIYLRHEGGLDCYLDAITGQEMHIARDRKRGRNS